MAHCRTGIVAADLEIVVAQDYRMTGVVEERRSCAIGSDKAQHMCVGHYRTGGILPDPRTLRVRLAAIDADLHLGTRIVQTARLAVGGRSYHHLHHGVRNLLQVVDRRCDPMPRKGKVSGPEWVWEAHTMMAAPAMPVARATCSRIPRTTSAPNPTKSTATRATRAVS